MLGLPVRHGRHALPNGDSTGDQRAAMPTLREALTGLAATMHGRDDVAVTGVSADSRTTRPGDIFVAVRGLSDDGHRHISAAVAHGARAIVSEQPPAPESAVSPVSSIPWVTVP